MLGYSGSPGAGGVKRSAISTWKSPLELVVRTSAIQKVSVSCMNMRAPCIPSSQYSLACSAMSQLSSRSRSACRATVAFASWGGYNGRQVVSRPLDKVPHGNRGECRSIDASAIPGLLAIGRTKQSPLACTPLPISPETRTSLGLLQHDSRSRFQKNRSPWPHQSASLKEASRQAARCRDRVAIADGPSQYAVPFAGPHDFRPRIVASVVTSYELACTASPELLL